MITPGVRDVTFGLQKCIDDAYDAGLACFLPPGRYLVSAPIVAAQVRKTPSLPRSWGNLQPFLAVFPQECMGCAWAKLHLLGRPNTFLAPDRRERAGRWH